MAAYDTALDRELGRWSHLPSRALNGTKLVANLPHIAPEAFLHRVYPGLSDAEIEKLEAQIGLGRFPPDLRDFYSRYNGMDLFAGSLSIFGLRSNCEREGDAPLQQPFSLVTPNVPERLRDATNGEFFFGWYDFDGSLLYIDPVEHSIHRTAPDSMTILSTWPDFGSFLSTEVKRLADFFDEQGQFDEDEDNTPPAVLSA